MTGETFEKYINISKVEQLGVINRVIFADASLFQFIVVPLISDEKE